MSFLKELTDFLICSICLLNIIHNEQSLNTTIGQNENDSAAFKKVKLVFPCDFFVGVSDRIQCLFFLTGKPTEIDESVHAHFTKLLTIALMIALQVVKASFCFH